MAENFRIGLGLEITTSPEDLNKQIDLIISKTDVKKTAEGLKLLGDNLERLFKVSQKLSKSVQNLISVEDALKNIKSSDVNNLNKAFSIINTLSKTIDSKGLKNLEILGDSLKVLKSQFSLTDKQIEGSRAFINLLKDLSKIDLSKLRVDKSTLDNLSLLTKTLSSDVKEIRSDLHANLDQKVDELASVKSEIQDAVKKIDSSILFEEDDGWDFDFELDKAINESGILNNEFKREVESALMKMSKEEFEQLNADDFLKVLLQDADERKDAIFKYINILKENADLLKAELGKNIQYLGSVFDEQNNRLILKIKDENVGNVFYSLNLSDDASVIKSIEKFGADFAAIFSKLDTEAKEQIANKAISKNLLAESKDSSKQVLKKAITEYFSSLSEDNELKRIVEDGQFSILKGLYSLSTGEAVVDIQRGENVFTLEFRIDYDREGEVYIRDFVDFVSKFQSRAEAPFFENYSPKEEMDRIAAVMDNINKELEIRKKSINLIKEDIKEARKEAEVAQQKLSQAKTEEEIKALSEEYLTKQLALDTARSMLKEERSEYLEREEWAKKEIERLEVIYNIYAEMDKVIGEMTKKERELEELGVDAVNRQKALLDYYERIAELQKELIVGSDEQVTGYKTMVGAEGSIKSYFNRGLIEYELKTIVNEGRIQNIFNRNREHMSKMLESIIAKVIEYDFEEANERIKQGITNYVQEIASLRHNPQFAKAIKEAGFGSLFDVKQLGLNKIAIEARELDQVVSYIFELNEANKLVLVDLQTMAASSKNAGRNILEFGDDVKVTTDILKEHKQKIEEAIKEISGYDASNLAISFSKQKGTNTFFDAEFTDKLTGRLVKTTLVLDNLNNEVYIMGEEFKDASQKMQPTLDNLFAYDQHVEKIGSNLKELRKYHQKLIESFKEMAKAQGIDLSGIKFYDSGAFQVGDKQYQTFSVKDGVIKTIRGYDKATGSIKEFDLELNKIEGTINRILPAKTKLVAKTGEWTKALKKVPVWLTTGMLWHSIIRGIKNVARQIVVLDTKMVELKKVMDDSTDFAKIFDDATKTARAYNTEIGKVLDAYAIFARQGFGADVLDSVSRLAITMSNVGNIDVEKAASSLIAIASGFDIQVQNLTSVVDALNEVDNNFAVTLETITEAMAKSSATAKSFGVEINTLIGYITAIGEVTREAGDVIGNSLKTIFTRITTNASAMQALENLAGIEVRGESGIKSVQQVIDELAKSWDSLSRSQQQYIAKEIAGRHQVQRFLALMNNYKTAIEATEAAMNSQGSAAVENLRKIRSLQSVIESARNEFQIMADRLGESGLRDELNTLLYLFRGVMEVVNEILKLFNLAPGTLTGLIIALGGVTFAVRVLKIEVNKLMGVWGLVLTTVSAVTSAIVGQIAKQKQFRQEVELTAEALKNLEGFTIGDKKYLETMLEKWKELEDKGFLTIGEMKQKMEIEKILKEKYPFLFKDGKLEYKRAIKALEETVVEVTPSSTDIEFNFEDFDKMLKDTLMQATSEQWYKDMNIFQEIFGWRYRDYLTEGIQYYKENINQVIDDILNQYTDAVNSVAGEDRQISVLEAEERFYEELAKELGIEVELIRQKGLENIIAVWGKLAGLGYDEKGIRERIANNFDYYLNRFMEGIDKYDIGMSQQGAEKIHNKIREIFENMFSDATYPEMYRDTFDVLEVATDEEIEQDKLMFYEDMQSAYEKFAPEFINKIFDKREFDKLVDKVVEYMSEGDLDERRKAAEIIARKIATDYAESVTFDEEVAMENFEENLEKAKLGQKILAMLESGAELTSDLYFDAIEKFGDSFVFHYAKGRESLIEYLRGEVVQYYGGGLTQDGSWLKEEMDAVEKEISLIDDYLQREWVKASPEIQKIFENAKNELERKKRYLQIQADLLDVELLSDFELTYDRLNEELSKLNPNSQAYIDKLREIIELMKAQNELTDEQRLELLEKEIELIDKEISKRTRNLKLIEQTKKQLGVGDQHLYADTILADLELQLKLNDEDAENELKILMAKRQIYNEQLELYRKNVDFIKEALKEAEKQQASEEKIAELRERYNAEIMNTISLQNQILSNLEEERKVVTDYLNEIAKKKQEQLDDDKKAHEERLKQIKEYWDNFIEEQKKARKQAAAEKEMDEMLSKAAMLQVQLNRLAMDTSREGRSRYEQLLQEYNKLQKEIQDTREEQEWEKQLELWEQARDQAIKDVESMIEGIEEQRKTLNQLIEEVTEKIVKGNYEIGESYKELQTILGDEANWGVFETLLQQLRNYSQEIQTNQIQIPKLEIETQDISFDVSELKNAVVKVDNKDVLKSISDIKSTLEKLWEVPITVKLKDPINVVGAVAGDKDLNKILDTLINWGHKF